MAVKKATTVADLKETAKEPKGSTVKVKSPSGAVTEVPEGILEALLESGYTKTK